VPGAGQSGELRVQEPFTKGERVLHGYLLVAVADHDERRPCVAGEIGDGEVGSSRCIRSSLAVTTGKCSGPSVATAPPDWRRHSLVHLFDSDPMELLERRWNGHFGQIPRGDLWLYADGRFVAHPRIADSEARCRSGVRG
jgi:hypothetical protein